MNERAAGLHAQGGKQLRKGLLAVVETIAILLLMALVVLVLANSLSRYLLSAPLVWTEEIVKALLMWLGALGITVAALRGGLITCGIWTARLSGRAQARLAKVHNVIGILVMGVLAYLAWNYVHIFGKDLSPLLGIPKGVAISGIIACAVGLMIAFLIDLIAPEVPQC